MQTDRSVDQIVPLASDERVEAAPPAVLDNAQLGQVGGGLAPNGTWSASTSTDAPNGTW